MEFQQGDRVKNQSTMEWGKGEILESLGAEKYKIFFVNVGEKIIDASIANLLKLEGEERNHPLLDNLKLPDKNKVTKFISIRDLVSLFFRIFPKGFYDDTYFRDERQYKVGAHELMLELLDEGTFSNLINSRGYDEICKKALKVVRKTNLIFPNEQMALSDGLKSAENRESFSRNFYKILYGKNDLSARFEDFAQCLEDINASKWTTQTYFLFITFPEKYGFMKPSVTQYAADAFAFELNYRSEINWKSYETLLKFYDYVSKELSELDDYLRPRDMIDVQSFIWCSVPGKYY